MILTIHTKYSSNDHEETLKNETVEPEDSEESYRSEITVRKELIMKIFVIVMSRHQNSH